MNSATENTYQSSMNPFINEHNAILEGLYTRQDNLKEEFVSLVDGISFTLY